jgi:anti-sigma factor RsiW
MTEKLQNSGPHSMDPAELERWLWAYAGGLLEPDEEAALAWHLAGDPTAQARLQQIRQSFDTLAARSGLTLAEARSRNTGWAFQLGRLVSSARRRWFESREQSTGEFEAGLLAIAVLTPRGLVALAQQAGVICSDASGPRTLMRGDQASPSPAEEGSLRQLITAPDGTQVTLTAAGEQKVDVLIELADKSAKGVAELRQVTTQGGSPARRRVAVASIENGIASFQRTSAGLLEIVVPGARPIVVGVTAPAETPRKD